MSWFDEQIRNLKQNDQDAFEKALLRMASVVSGDGESDDARDERMITRNSIDRILMYFHIKPADIPDSVRGGNEMLEYALHPHGIMRRRIRLEGDWHKTSFGPILAFRKDTADPVPLLPNHFRGYSCVDPDTGKETVLNKKTAAEFDRDAICFYKPLPDRKLGIRDLIHYFRSCLALSDYLLPIVLTVLGTLVGTMIPYITRMMTHFVLLSGMVPILVSSAVFLVCVTFSQLLISLVHDLAISRIKVKGGLQTESALMMRLINLPPAFFRGYAPGELSARFQFASELTDMLVSEVIASVVPAVMSLAYVGVIANLAPSLALPALMIVALSGVINVSAGIMLAKIRRNAMEQNTKISGLTFSIIDGIQKIRTAGAEKRAFAKWGNSYAGRADLVYNLPFFPKYCTLLTSAVTLAGTILLYALAFRNSVTPSEYIAFNSAFGMLAGVFASVVTMVLNFTRIRPVFQMVEPILSAVPEPSSDRKPVLSLKGDIELSNVCFRYTDSMPYVLDGVSLKISAGEYVAVVGPTGCGKSTLMRLLLGFETPEKGAVYYDGMDIARLDKHSLRRKIGSVTQDDGLFQGSIYSNIVITNPELDSDAAWEAAEIAGIADDIRKMPMKMHTLVTEGQSGLSGGQKQRLMIARAIAPKPGVLIFDEATSALDNKTQKQISEALDRLRCTRIVIAHRLSTIRNCHRILMLDGGHIVEEGTYDELIAKNGRFAELVARQRL